MDSSRVLFGPKALLRAVPGMTSLGTVRDIRSEEMMDTSDSNVVVEFPARIREIRTYPGLDLANETWKARLANGTASRDDLVVWILTIDDAGYETIPGSMGMDWIWNHPNEFASLVGDVDEFVLSLLAIVDEALEALKVGNPRATQVDDLRWWFFKSFPCKRELMALLSPAMRELWISEIYPRFGATNDLWIDTAVWVSVPRQIIAAAVLKRLGVIEDPRDFLEHGHHSERSSQPWSALWSLGLDREQMEELRPNIGKDPSVAFVTIEALLASGTERRETDFHSLRGFSPWNVLNNTELYQALMICAQKGPNQTMAILEDATVKHRLSMEKIDRILMAALIKITSLQGLTLETLDRQLTASGRDMLARQLEPVKSHWLEKTTAQFLFKVLCEIPKNKREAFFLDVIVPVIDKVFPVRLYTAWRQLKLTERDLEITLRDKLHLEGYAIGHIQTGTIPSGKRQGQRQYFVQLDGVRYVCDDDIHRRYYPTAGDEVVFNTGERVRWLVPSRVGVTVMTPVMKDIER